MNGADPHHVHDFWGYSPPVDALEILRAGRKDAKLATDIPGDGPLKVFEVRVRVGYWARERAGWRRPGRREGGSRSPRDSYLPCYDNLVGYADGIE